MAFKIAPAASTSTFSAELRATARAAEAPGPAAFDTLESVRQSLSSSASPLALASIKDITTFTLYVAAATSTSTTTTTTLLLLLLLLLYCHRYYHYHHHHPHPPPPFSFFFRYQWSPGKPDAMTARCRVGTALVGYDAPSQMLADASVGRYVDVRTYELKFKRRPQS